MPTYDTYLKPYESSDDFFFQKVMRDLMVCSGPMKVLDFVMEDLNHKNPKMREDILIYIIYALLTFPR